MLKQITEPLSTARDGAERALQAAYEEHHRLQRERAQLPDTMTTRQDATRRFAYDQALQRAATTIEELEAVSGGPLTAQQRAALEHDAYRRSSRDRGVTREPLTEPDLEFGRD